MKESGKRGSAYTLEDLIKIHSQKPPKEMLDGVASARTIMNEFKLASVLGINTTDSVLLHAYLAERVMRTRIYDFDWITYSPEFDFTKKDIEKDDKDRQKLQDSLDSLVLRSSEMVENSYNGGKLRIRARNLELSANDLIARGSIYNEKRLATEIMISDELMDSWTKRWKNKFKKRSGHARQKNLYYLARL